MKILVTGANGFIGKQIVAGLAAANHDVVRLQRKPVVGVLECDLLDAVKTEIAIKKLKGVDVLVHTAALAHGQKDPQGYGADSPNVQMTKNLINALKGSVGKAIFLSSISVYGPENLSQRVALRKDPRPITGYGRGKLVCEEIFFNGGFREVHVLRLPPVFDESHLTDVRKRVVLPGIQLVKMRIVPAPRYSLLHISRLVEHICELMTSNNEGNWLHHLSDPSPYSQHKICEWFEGIHLQIPVALTRPFLKATALLPPRIKYRLQDYYWKLFETTVFEPGRIRIDD